jgi:SanA protein
MLLGGWLLGRLLRPVLALIVLAALIVGGANAWVLLTARGHEARSAQAAPRADVVLVLGAGLDPDGGPSAMLADRLRTAVAVYRTGRVGHVLVSGDHGTKTYDEVDAMAHALQTLGVPRERIVCDHAGFDTWDSMVRARKVFGVRSADVVTQGFHLSRALFLGERAGLRVTGVNADRRGYGTRRGVMGSGREVISRVKAAADAARGSAPRFLGPRIALDGGAWRTCNA